MVLKVSEGLGNPCKHGMLPLECLIPLELLPKLGLLLLEQILGPEARQLHVRLLRERPGSSSGTRVSTTPA